MENKELLFNLIKKLENGEICFNSDGRDGKYWLEMVDNNKDEVEEKDKVYLGKWVEWKTSHPDRWWLHEANELNKAFKENFYKEKGLDKIKK